MADFRIEIPIEVINKTDPSMLRALETELQKIYTNASKSKSATQDLISSIEEGTSDATSSMKTLERATDNTSQGFEEAAESAKNAGTSGEQAAEKASDAAEDLSDSVEEAASSFEQSGKSAEEAGSRSRSALNNAGQHVDKFTERIEKSQRSIRKMFSQKLQLTLAAIDKVSPVLKFVGTTVKNLTSKAWHVAVRMTDFVTAPYRKLVQMISSPIAMTISLAGVGLSAGSFLNTFTDFSAGMSNVKAISGATEEEFKRLTATAENLGATTKFTATEASQGMQYLAMAGWDTAEIIDAMPGMLNLAAAGATDLGTAADIVSDVMTAMSMQASEATRAADVFAKTASSTNTSIAGLGATMKYAAPIAHSFGMTLEDVAAAAGLMANAGIKGEMAGTALRASLLRMANPTAEMQEAMDSLGISFADSTGKMKSMSQIVKMLETSLGGMSEADKLATAQVLFSTEAASAWIGLIEQGSEAYDELSESLYGAKGAAAEMSKVQLDNLAGDMTILQSAVDGMKISLMQELNPYLRSGVQWITNKIPEITDKIIELTDTGISKAKELKTFIKEVFDSSDFQNADGFAEKFFVAWDKIIAEPFDEWWSGNGQGMVLGIVEKAGSGLGQMYHGIIAGILAAIKGEEIDFEGMNLTGLAKAGAEAAKTFVDSFKKSFDLGGLWNDTPGMMKAGAIGFGTFKVGGGALNLLKKISQMKTAFAGASTTATAAAAATNSFGAATATAAIGTTKAATALSAIKAGLSAIPGWGWVAAAALAAATVGFVAWSNAQKEHERDLLNTGKAAAQMAQDYSASVEQIAEATDSMETIKKITLQIEEDTGGNQVVINGFKNELSTVQDRIVWLTAKLTDDTLSKEEVDKYQSELDTLHGKTVEVVANLNDQGYDAAQVAVIQEQVNAIEEGEKKVTLTIAKNTSLTPDEIAAYVTQLSALMTKKTEYELYIHGSGLTAEQITAYKTELDKIESKKADIDVKLNKGQGTMSDEDWNKLVSEAASLHAQAADIEMVLKGSEMNQAEINDVKTKLGEVRGEATGIFLKIGYSEDSDISQEELNAIIDDLSNIGEVKAQLNIGLAKGSMGVEQLEELNKQLNEAYANLIEVSGGYFTQEDVEQGRITQERYDNWLKNKTVEAEADRLLFQAQVEKDRGNVAELVEKRDAAKATAANYSSTGYNSSSDYDFLYGLDQQRRQLLGQYQTGQITIEDLMSGGVQILQQARERNWSQMEPANFMAVQPIDLFGKYTGGLFGTGLFGHWEADSSVDPFANALGELKNQIGGATTNTDTYNAQADEANAALMHQYQNEVRVVEQTSFAGFGVTDKNSKATIQELAESYNTLDTAGQQMFTNAIAGLAELNSTTDYITDAEKVNLQEILDSASQSVTVSANVEVLGSVSSKLTELSDAYQKAGSEVAQADFNADNLEAVNAALESLGIEKIKDLGELGAKLSEIAAIDPSGLNFNNAAASLTALGGSAESARIKAAAAQSQLTALAGTYNVTISVNTIGSIPSLAPGTKVKQNANGGIYDGAFLSWVAEDGPEAIIPLGSARRERGLDLWMKAGEMLGVQEFADGGIMAPYAGAIADLPDFVLDDEDAPAPIAAPTGNGGGQGQQTIQVSIDSSPTFEIKGDSPGDIMTALKSHMKELAELLGTEFAEQISDIILNIA